jgi:hypothetical protein
LLATNGEGNIAMRFMFQHTSQVVDVDVDVETATKQFETLTAWPPLSAPA